jgi:all-trans-8'-apo-beta-carotenal 15,15'-oxygenase
MSHEIPTTWPMLFKTGQEQGVGDDRSTGAECIVEYGTIPPELDGDLVAMGPLQFEVQGEPVNSWFDGQGGVHRIRLMPGHNQATVWTRVIESESYKDEVAAGKQTINHFHMRDPTTGLLKGAETANVSNTQMMVWRDHWLALYEGGVPVEMDPETLDSLDEVSVDIPMLSGEHLSAHFHNHPSGDVYNYGLVHDPAEPNLHHTQVRLYRFPAGERDPNGDKAELVGSFLHRDFPFLHDFILTENHAVFVIPPIGLLVGDQIVNKGTLSDNFLWKNTDTKTRVVVLRLSDGRMVGEYKFDPIWIWHFINAYETPITTGGTRITIDWIEYGDYDDDVRPFVEQIHTGNYPRTIAGSRVVRALIDIGVSAGESGLPNYNWKRERIIDISCEFGRISPDYETKTYAFSYIAAHSSLEACTSCLWDTLGKVSMTSRSCRRYSLGREQIPSEPIFVPRKDGNGEDDGYLLCIVYDGLRNRSVLTIIDAAQLGWKGEQNSEPYDLPEAALVAKVLLPHRVPVTFHRIWVPKARR